jgi:hypothetical protein
MVLVHSGTFRSDAMGNIEQYVASGATTKQGVFIEYATW